MNEIFYNVPDKIIENVKRYLKEQLPQYELVKVLRKSAHPLDNYLYMVIAKHTNYPEIKSEYGGGKYTLWTCWNETTQCLNWGHYDIKTEAEALEMASVYFSC